MSLKGGCLCRGVTYEADRLDAPPMHCHCITCRKAHGSAYTTTARVLRDAFRFTSGADLLRAYESCPGKLRQFCARCGTHLFAEFPDRPYVILRIATLDDDPEMRPAFHIWTSHDVPWLDPDCPSFPEWQPGR